MFEIIYTPRIEDEVVIATHSSITDAKQHMKKIKKTNLKAFKHHYIYDNIHKEPPEEDSAV